MIFCNITEELIDELVRLVKRKTVVDCGAGERMLEKESAGKLSVVSLDLYPRDPDTVRADCTKFAFHKGLIPVFIRPSHGGWVGATIRKNEYNVGFFLYIGLAKNLYDDLGAYREEATIVSDWVGDEGEQIYRIDGLYSADGVLGEYHLISDKYQQGRWWVELAEDGMYTNDAGGRMCTEAKSFTVHEKVRAACFQELDWSGTYLVDSDSDAGWLDREGRFYGCPREGHDDYAYYIFEKSVRELEETGWVRIYHAELYVHEKPLSAEQKNWLSSHGHTVFDGEL